MKWETADLTVGAVVIVAVLILASALIWLSPALAERTYPLYTEFQRIDGIGERAPVQLHGYSIGRVESIEPRVKADGSLVFRVRMAINWRLASGDTLFLPEGTRALLVPPPAPIVPGAIVLDVPGSSEGQLRPGSFIPGVRDVAMLDQVRAMSGDLTDQLVQTMTTARALMDTLLQTVGVANQAARVTTTELPVLLNGVKRQLAATEVLTEELRGHLGTLTPLTAATVDTARMLLTDSRELVREVERVLNSREGDVAGILANLDTTTVLLNHFVRQVSARPWRLLTGVGPPLGFVPADSVATDTTTPAPPPEMRR